jgi:hypothetical protein
MIVDCEQSHYMLREEIGAVGGHREMHAIFP